MVKEDVIDIEKIIEFEWNTSSENMKRYRDFEEEYGRQIDKLRKKEREKQLKATKKLRNFVIIY